MESDRKRFGACDQRKSDVGGQPNALGLGRAEKFCEASGNVRESCGASKKADLRAEIWTTAPALLTDSAIAGRIHCDPVTRRERSHRRSNRHDFAGDLMTEDQRFA
jgi:hypothetical protein